MKTLIIGPRGCGKTKLIHEKLFSLQAGDVIIDPFDEHRFAFPSNKKLLLAISNIYNLRYKPINELRKIITKFLDDVNAHDGIGTIFIDSADIIDGNLDWMVKYLTAEEFKNMNLCVVCQSIEKCKNVSHLFDNAILFDEAWWEGKFRANHHYQIANAKDVIMFSNVKPPHIFTH